MKKSKVYYVLLFIVILITLLMIFPFVWTIVMSFKTDNDIINGDYEEKSVNNNLL